MKTIFTLLFVLTIGVTAQAQDTKSDVKVETAQMTIVTSNTNGNTVARLYKFKDSKIKKALSFTTKRNKAKLA
ncbi:MAG: hypothetical protein WBM98_06380 [Maribacter sp.]|uniref:hypothetical protein n=1 Tax=Maribacter sp. TaxID=1897614 RepID=UPI003C73083C